MMSFLHVSRWKTHHVPGRGPRLAWENDPTARRVRSMRACPRDADQVARGGVPPPPANAPSANNDSFAVSPMARTWIPSGVMPGLPFRRWAGKQSWGRVRAVSRRGGRQSCNSFVHAVHPCSFPEGATPSSGGYCYTHTLSPRSRCRGFGVRTGLTRTPARGFQEVAIESSWHTSAEAAASRVG